MSEVDVLPELKQIVGALLFAAKTPISASQIRRVFQSAGESNGGVCRDFAAVKEKDIRDAVEALRQDFETGKLGLAISEVASGYRLENDRRCGLWVRELLQRGKPNRLSRPALETLAIIAYRQPCVRSEIEAVRGVAVDQILRNLMEMQLVKIAGRSDLPGRPMLYGTTQKFLEHFGINHLNDLPGVEELRRIELSKKETAEGGGEPVFQADESADSEGSDDKAGGDEDG